MAISVAWVVNSTAVTSQNSIYTVPANTSATYAYARDLVITNAGVNTVFIAVNANAAAATTTGSFAVPTGGSVILTQCQVPGGTIINATCPTAAGSSVSIGYATNVAYI